MNKAEHPEAIQILYCNYRGETSTRTIVPSNIWFGSTAWHTESQWFLDAVDLDKGVVRSFALMDILKFVYAYGDTP